MLKIKLIFFCIFIRDIIEQVNRFMLLVFYHGYLVTCQW